MSEAGHRASARDIGVIAAAIVRDYPQYYTRYYGLKEYTYNKIRQDNRNLLLRRDATVDGMKTGFTDAAGYCLVASATRDYPNLGAGNKRRLLSVVLGTGSREARANESQKLLNWGFTAFDPVRLFDGGKPIVTPEVWKGRERQAKLGAAGPVVIAVPRGEGDKLKTAIERTDPLVAPLAKGQRVGTLKVTSASGAAVTEVPLVVQEAVEEAGIFGRAWDAMRLWIK
jgi:D-alanyl-D-alanine carboxypeptidase (penicillin-binding protein 5/6)